MVKRFYSLIINCPLSVVVLECHDIPHQFVLLHMGNIISISLLSNAWIDEDVKLGSHVSLAFSGRLQEEKGNNHVWTMS